MAAKQATQLALFEQPANEAGACARRVERRRPRANEHSMAKRSTHTGFTQTGMSRVFIAALTLLSLATFAVVGVARAALEIDDCGVVVPEGETAYLVTDLQCDASSPEGIVLSDGARLVLGGYGIFARSREHRPHAQSEQAAGAAADAPLQGVRCRTGSVCTIVGPGEISGFAASGIAGTRVRARDVVVSDNGRAGIVAYENVVLRNSLIAGNGSLGVHAGGRLHSKGSQILAHPDAAALEWRHPRIRPDDDSCSID
jgi:hypothetical protein